MVADRRIFLFRDLPSMGIEDSLVLIDSSISVNGQSFLTVAGKQTYLETYRFGDDLLVTETDYILLPKKLVVLRDRVIYYPV